MMDVRSDFARKLRARKTVAGAFIKFNDPAAVEMLGYAGFDFAILDAEHGAFDRGQIALMSLAARAVGLPLLVRIPEPTAAWIATAVDTGCAGVVVPQVKDAEAARKLVQMMRHGAGGLGFSPSTPGAQYGERGIAQHLARHAAETVLICQIEDRSAVEEAAAIAQIDGVDALFLGPVDLAVSIQSTDPASAEVMALCRQAIIAGTAAGKATGLFLTDFSRSADWQAAGATIFAIGSDQAFMMRAAKAGLKAFRDSFSVDANHR